MIQGKNFTALDVADIPVDSEYLACNFARPQPRFDGANYVGVRLFPGDDTPRTFVQCNLVNCEPPPGSTMIRCNTSVLRRGVLDKEDVIVVDGVEVARRRFNKVVGVGRLNPETGEYIYYQTPMEAPE